MLRFDFHPGKEEEILLLKTLPLVLAVKIPLLYRFGLLRGWWRYVGLSDAFDIAKASFLSTALLFPLVKYLFRFQGYPRSVLAIDFVLTFMLMAGARLAVRAYTESAQRGIADRRTLLVGAGQAGSKIVRELKRDPQLNLDPIGFVDDDPSKRGIRIHGVKVLGSTDRLPELIRKLSVDSVLITIPSATGREIEQILSKCREHRVDLRILPPISQHINGNGSTRKIREVRLEDLLGRKPVSIDVAKIRSQIEGQVLLVTGAGGSIGSELCRQIASFSPREIILLERAENCLFKLGLELARRFPSQRFVPVVGDIQDVGTIRDVFALHRPHIVFHAAAYKHVPMMEGNCFQAISNNIFGTYNVALLARQFNTCTFVMVSSDKAVHPTNIMGVTKRIAELIILGLQDEETRYVAVRFGNVLGSEGSVVPIFQEQIARGGPVTVTHPEVKRYFMTIPEAVQLVLQASAMGHGSEIFALDMGEPVKILDLAQSLIRLSGLEPGQDIKTVFSGLRPGEKLFEEIMLEGEGIMPTDHPKIRVLNGGKVSFEQVRLWLEELSFCLEAKNVNALVETLQHIVPEYQPSKEILAQCEIDRHDLAFHQRRTRAKLSYPVQSAA